MEYAPVKNVLRNIVRGNAALNKLFFKALGILFLRERYVKRELGEVFANIAETEEILDAGFGYGQYSFWTARNFPQTRITAVEIEKVMLEDFADLLKKTGVANIELKQLDLTTMEYKSRFDLALSVDVMEHIEDDRTVFRNICRSLKPGGVFLMHTPHIKAGAERGEGVFVGEHFRDGYTTEELLGKLKEAGFDRIEYKLTYGKWGALAWRLLQKYPISVLRKAKILFLLLPIYLIIVFPIAEIAMRMDMSKEQVEGDGILVKAYRDLKQK